MSSKKIKILYISRTSKFTGAENILLDIVKNLNKEKFYPIVALPDKKGLFYSKLIQSSINTIIIKMPFLRVTYNPFLLIWFAISIIFINMIFFFVIIGLKVDIVTCHTIQESFYLAVPTKLLGKKFIICFKNILDRKWKKYVRAKFTGLFADKVVAVSKKALEDFTYFHSEKVNNRKAHVIYDCLNYREYTKDIYPESIYNFLKKDKGDFIIANIGNLTELKGQMLLVNALSSKKLRNTGIKVLLIGDIYDKKDQIYKDKIVKEIKANNLEERIFLIGYQKNVKGILASTDAIVHCPVIDDALPRVILEGFALRNIVVATKVGGIPEMISDGYNGFLVDADRNSLAEKIYYVYKNRDSLGKIKENAMETLLNRFDLEKQINDLEFLYINL